MTHLPTARATNTIVGTVLTVVSAGAMLVVAALAFIALYGAVGELPGNVEIALPTIVDLDARSIPTSAPAVGVDAARLEGVRGEGILRFRPSSRLYVVAAGAVPATVLFAAVWVLWQVRALLRTFRAGRPFVRENAVRLQRIGLAIVALEVARWAIAYAWGSHVRSYFSADGVEFVAPLHLNAMEIVAGLVVLTVAEAFRAGTRLDEDQSLTV